MGPGGTFALTTFLSGVLLLLGWFYATAGNPRSGALFRKSLLLFVLPMIGLALAAPRLAWLQPALWIGIASEEGLKAFASTRERSRLDRFWLLALFGIWELTLFKPLWGLLIAFVDPAWDRWTMAGLLYATALPALLHAVTAAVYAFAFERRLWAAFLASCVLHACFDWVAGYFAGSPAAVIVETAILAAMLAALFRWHRRSVVEAP